MFVNSITALNFMYSMERFATAIYKVQKGVFNDKTVHERLLYAIDNESQHASNLKNRIVELKKAPFPLAFLFQWAGTLLGCISRCFSKEMALKTDTAIEKRAVKDYSYFLRTLDLDDKTQSLIRNIISDEELHIRNWQDSIKILKAPSENG